MQGISILSTGYFSSVNELSKLNNLIKKSNETDDAKAQQQQKVLAEEQSIKAKLGSAAEVQTTYHYALGTDGRQYITGASVTMKGSEDAINRVSGGITSEDVQSAIKAEREERAEIALRETDERRNNLKAQNAKADDELTEEEQQQIRELEQTQNEVVAHEHAHQAAAGEFGGGISYTYTQGPDGKSYITGGEVPIHLREGATPEETLQNMQKVQAAANAPNDPSGQDLKVAAKAAAQAMKARQEISNENISANSNSETSSTNYSNSGTNDLRALIASGTPVIDANGNIENNYPDPEKNGASSTLASIRAYQIQSLAFINPAA